MTDGQFAHFQVRSGDVLLNEGQSLELVGRCSLYSDEYPGPCAMQNQLLRFRARQGVSASFSSHLFRHCQQKGVFARVALQTTSIAHLGGSRFERLRLAWPTTEREQRAIAGALSMWMPCSPSSTISSPRSATSNRPPCSNFSPAKPPAGV